MKRLASLTSSGAAQQRSAQNDPREGHVAALAMTGGRHGWPHIRCNNRPPPALLALLGASSTSLALAPLILFYLLPSSSQSTGSIHHHLPPCFGSIALVLTPNQWIFDRLLRASRLQIFSIQCTICVWVRHTDSVIGLACKGCCHLKVSKSQGLSNEPYSVVFGLLII